MTWQEAIEHPSLDGLPFKIELNGDGNIIMSPTYNAHGARQFQIGLWLSKLLPDGKVATEIAIQTSDNVKVTDAAWLTMDHWQIAEHELACTTAPAICVEVASKSNYKRELNEKKALYFEAGAREVWFCDLMGNMDFYTPEGQAPTSPMCPEFPATV